MKKGIILTFAVAVLLVGCAPDPVRLQPLEVVKEYDDVHLTCREMRKEILKYEDDLERLLADEHKHGAAREGDKLLAAPIVIPILVMGTLLVGYDGLAAKNKPEMSAAQQRIVRIKHLREVMNDKGCVGDSGTDARSAEQPAAKEKSCVIICNDDQTCVAE